MAEISTAPAAVSNTREQPLKVLLLEDRPDDANLIQIEMRRSGLSFTCTRVDNQQDFIKALNQSPDLILADFNLPQFDALHALDILNARKLDIPLIVVTGSLSDEMAVACIKKGAADYLLKDRMARLSPAIKNALADRLLREERRQAAEQLLQRNQELAFLADFSASMRATLSPRELYPLILQGLNRLVDLQGEPGGIKTFSLLVVTQPHSLPGIPAQLICQACDLNGKPPPQINLPIQFELPAIIHLDSLHFGPEPPAWLVDLLQRIQALSLLDDLQSHCTIPLRVEKSGAEPSQVPDASNLPVGLVYLATSQPEEASRLPVSLLDTLAGQAAAAIQRAEFHQRAQDNLERLQALRSIDIAISSSLDLRVTLSVLLDNAMIHTGADAMSIALLQPLSQSLQFAASRGFRTQPSQNPASRLPQDLPGQAILERRFLFVPDLDAELPQVLDMRGSAMGILSRRERAQVGRRRLLRPELADEGIRAAGAIPLVAKGVVKGVLEVFFRRPFLPDPEWKSFLETLAGQAAIAIDTATLFEQVQRANIELANSYEVTLESWSKLLEARGVESPGHTQRIARQVVDLGRLLGWSATQIANARRGAYLHDIGLSSIPDHILLQKGPPSEEEWQVIHRHPQVAYDLLQSISLVRPALETPLNHHEHWNGKGYPRGIREERIPLSARLFSILDTWDAMTHDRPWRPALSAVEARDYVQQQAGEQFDPHLVQVFLDNLGSLKNIVK